MFDLDGSGFIDIEELRKIVKATNMATDAQLERKVLLPQCQLRRFRWSADRPATKCNVSADAVADEPSGPQRGWTDQLRGVPRPREAISKHRCEDLLCRLRNGHHLAQAHGGGVTRAVFPAFSLANSMSAAGLVA